MEGGFLKVVLVGGTGRFGSRVARALLARPDVSLRLVVRPGRGGEVLEDLMDRGATVLEGDLADERSLDAALEGAHAVVSAVNGGPEVVVDGQLRLLRAAQRQGVQRFIPSDFAPDYFSLREGEHALLDMRRRVAEAVERSGVGHTFILLGGLTEVVLSPLGGMFDFHARRAYRWGHGEAFFDVTSTEDAAQLVALAVDHPRAHNRRLEFAGDVVSFNGVVALFEEVTGHPLHVVDCGPLEALRARIARRRAAGEPVEAWAYAQGVLMRMSGAGKLHHPANSDFAALSPLRVRDYLMHHFGAGAPTAEASA